MRQFIWSLALTIALLSVFAEIATPFVQRKHITHILPVHKTLYLARNINDNEMFYIVEAALEWNQVTNGQINFDVKRLPHPDIDIADAIGVINVTSDHPDVIVLDNENNHSTLGYFNSNSVLTHIDLVEERLSYKEYRPIMLHELGHSLGLEHNKGIDGIGTLMYPSEDLSADHITDTDLKNLCELYNCDASKFHGIPQI